MLPSGTFSAPISCRPTSVFSGANPKRILPSPMMTRRTRAVSLGQDDGRIRHSRSAPTVTSTPVSTNDPFITACSGEHT
jgi:hypothetical protein